ncbi:MAG: sialidase family protein [Ilumatobacteraceae bacterium]
MPTPTPVATRALPRHRHGRRIGGALVLLVAATTASGAAIGDAAAPTAVAIGADPYTNTSSQHATQVEPDSFAYGSTIVTAAQTGRFTNGGASNICFSTSSNSGSTWTNGCLPGITKHQNAANPYDRVSDPVVAYDAKHGVWMISSLPLLEAGGVRGAGVLTSRSTDGGFTWTAPVLVTDSNLGNPDKNWIVCDNTSTSPYYGNCYTQWDDNGDGNRLYMSTSTDGGLTWGSRKKPANNATGIGGQPVVQPSGRVVVPVDNANETALLAFSSTNGGASWSATTTITTISHHTVAGSLRTGPLPSAEIDAAGKVYVVWQDCRFRKGCKSNDIVMTTSTDGVTWSRVVRIPIDATTSSVDHFIPGLAVDSATSGSTAKLALAYYYYPTANCTSSTCSLRVGFVSSANGGGAWTAPMQLGTSMSLSWLPSTTQGRMVGDYISTSYSGGTAFPVFIVALAPTGTQFAQLMYSMSSGLSSGAAVATAGGDQPVPSAVLQRVPPRAPIRAV